MKRFKAQEAAHSAVPLTAVGGAAWKRLTTLSCAYYIARQHYWGLQGCPGSVA